MQSIDLSVYRPRAGTNQDDTAVLTISGELGITAMVGTQGEHSGVQGDTALIEALNKALPQAPKLVIVDINKVTYLSSLGIGALLRYQAQIKESGGEMRLAAPSELILALLKRCRLDHAFTIFPDLPSALKV